jgi:hypothetical protein
VCGVCVCVCVCVCVSLSFSIFLTSNGRGWALRNDEAIVTGQLVMEYVGEVICGEEVDLRSKEYQGKRHAYLLCFTAALPLLYRCFTDVYICVGACHASLLSVTAGVC